MVKTSLEVRENYPNKKIIYFSRSLKKGALKRDDLKIVRPQI